jgi:hypothetical protein
MTAAAIVVETGKFLESRRWTDFRRHQDVNSSLPIRIIEDVGAVTSEA